MMKSTNYKEYINSIEWDEKRSLRFRMDGFRCYKCGSPMNLQCHHITYERLGNERLSDLVTLCSDCHKRLHDPIRPQKTQDERFLDAANFIGGEELKDQMCLFLYFMDKLKTVMSRKTLSLLSDEFEYENSETEDLKIVKCTLREMNPIFKEVLNGRIDEF